MDTVTLPKLCHVCGCDVEPTREWMYEREGRFDPLRARCERCALRDQISAMQATLSDTYRRLSEAQAKLLDLIDGRSAR